MHIIVMNTDPIFQSDEPEYLFKAYYGRLCYYAFQFIKDRSMAEDVAQDAFVAYWKNRLSIAKHDTAIKDYLYTSVRNSCLNLLRREKVIGRYMDSRSPEDYSEDKLLHTLIEAEVIDALHKAINTLPDACRKVFTLGYLDGLSNSKIAEQLNISIHTVKTQKQRGLKVLRTKLDVKTWSVLLLFLSGL